MTAVAAEAPAPRIRVGVGGWTYPPWRDNFYPAGWPQQRELEFASRRLTAIEVNATFYGAQKPATFARWRDEVPGDFVFALKAPRVATHRRVLADAGDSVRRFVQGGIAELGPKLGPVVWQFPPYKAFDAAEFEAFIAQLPATIDGLPLRHALDVRHPSFLCPAYLALLRRHGVASVFTDAEAYPSFADVAGGFVYARLMRTVSTLPQGCTPQTLDALAACAGVWQAGGEPAGVPRIEPPPATPAAPRDVFLFFISGAKEKAPAAAMALLQRLSRV